MKLKSSDFVTGLFVVFGLFAIITMFVVVRGQFQKQDGYYAYFNNVAGLRAGASVVYEGYIIGTVEEITPEKTNTGMTFRVDVAVEQGWAIPKDSLAEISALSLLSAQSIQIDAGTAAPLAVGAQITSRPASNLMAELGRTADQFAQIASTSLVPLLVTIEDLLNEEARDALTGLKDLTLSVNQGVPEIISTVGRTADNLETASESVIELAGDDTQSAIGEVLDDVMQAADNVNAATKSVKTASSDAQILVEAISDDVSDKWLGKVELLLGRIDNSAGNLEEISKSVLRTASNIEEFSDGKVQRKIMKLIDDVEIIRGNLEIASESVITASNNAADLSDISEDRIEAFLQKLENAALNIEEMTARLRDDPSIIIRGSN